MLLDQLRRLPFLRRTAARFPITGKLTSPTDEPRRVGVVLHALKRDAAMTTALIESAARAAGWEPPRVYPTSATSFGREQAGRAVDDACDLVVACGGDGTVRMVAHALRHTGVPVGIIPSGTANIFARNLLLPLRDRRAAVAIALHGSEAPVDLGIATLTVSGTPEEHLFMVLAGIGHDAATVRDTIPSHKQHLGWLAYAGSAVRHVLRPPTPMTVGYAAAEPHVVNAWSVIVGSCGKVPGGVEIFPGAVVDDGLLDALEVAVSNPLQWLPIGAKGVLHLRSDVPGLRHTLTRRLFVEPAVPLPVQVDGDVFRDVDRMDVEVDARALVVRVATPKH